MIGSIVLRLRLWLIVKLLPEGYTKPRRKPRMAMAGLQPTATGLPLLERDDEGL